MAPKRKRQPTGVRRPMFVVQRHDASRLHYDFRLERDGVLKSWAVPRGVPLEPGDRRLAVQVDDHSLSYGGFGAGSPRASTAPGRSRSGTPASTSRSMSDRTAG